MKTLLTDMDKKIYQRLSTLTKVYDHNLSREKSLTFFSIKSCMSGQFHMSTILGLHELAWLLWKINYVKI